MIAFEPKDKSGTFWCDNLAELSDLLEMLGDERDAKAEQEYQQGYEDGYNVALEELTAPEPSPGIESGIVTTPSPLILPEWLTEHKDRLVA